MSKYDLKHLDTASLVEGLDAAIEDERAHTAEFVAHLAEVEARRLYLPAGHLTMRDFCIEELHIDEEEVDELLRAARASRTGG